MQLTYPILFLGVLYATKQTSTRKFNCDKQYCEDSVSWTLGYHSYPHHISSNVFGQSTSHNQPPPISPLVFPICWCSRLQGKKRCTPAIILKDFGPIHFGPIKGRTWSTLSDQLLAVFSRVIRQSRGDHQIPLGFLVATRFYLLNFQAHNFSENTNLGKIRVCCFQRMENVPQAIQLHWTCEGLVDTNFGIPGQRQVIFAKFSS